MTRQIINVGVADKGNGDPIRVAFSKANDNFAELYNILSNNTGGSIITTDVIGSVFADDSTLLVDGINGRIPYSVLSGAPIIPTNTNQLTNGSGYITSSSLTGLATVGYVDNVQNTVLNEIDSRVTSINYNDLLNKPNLAGAYSFSVAADDSTQRRISNNESIKFTGAGGITTASDAEGNITINYVQGDIRSEGNINIDINLADSTLRRWRFGEDGDLTLPSTSGFIDRLYTDNGGSRTKLEKKIESSPTTGTIAKLELDLDNGNIRLAIGNYTGGGDQWINTSTWAFRGDTGSLTLPPAGKIINNNKEWTFGTDGSLTLPTGGLIRNGYPGPAGGSGDGSSWLVAPTSGGGVASPDGKQYIQVDNVGLFIGTNFTGATGYDWTFGTDGSLRLPNDAVIKDTAGNSVSFGTDAGGNLQGNYSVAIGYGAAYTQQGNSAVAIGFNAGGGAQGNYAIAIGYHAGAQNQAANSIVLNATGITLDQTTANSFTVKPVRQGETANAMYYNSSTGEITYSDTFSFSVAADDSTQRLISNNESIKFTGAGGVTTSSDAEGNITITGSKVIGSWTVTNGTSTYSFTVPMDGTYVMWVKGNIPNGIITWNATLSISNTNVPAIGYQYAWNYTGGGTPISLTSIPNQIKGTAGTISTDATYAGTTSNRFDFGISNTSGASQTVYYGYTKIS